MSNRLSKNDFFVVFMILLSLACLIGGFFLGANFSRGKAEAEFKRYIAEVYEVEAPSTLLNYAHTDFVAYYHQVYLPFKEFRKLYVSSFEEAEQAGNYAQLVSMAADLRKQTANLRTQIENAQIPNTSPLLQKSQQEYLLALSAYENGFKRLSSLDKDLEQVVSLVEKGEEFVSGRKHWLTGQSQFYEALILWESFFVTQEAPQFIENPSQYTISEWSHLGFHQKNDLIAKLLIELNLVTLFNPEDVSIYINSLAASSQQNKQQKVIDALQFLSASKSIEEGRFIEKIKEYETVEVPMIPLFSNR